MSLQRRISELLSRPDYRPVDTATLADILCISKAKRTEFQDALDSLLASDRVRKSAEGLLRARNVSGMIEGTIKRISSGAGFLIRKREPGKPPQDDLFIGREDLGDAQTGDTVIAQLLRDGDRRDGRPRGRVVDVVERSARTFVGTYFVRGERGFVTVDGTIFQAPIAVGDPGAKGAQPGDKVVFDMLRFPSSEHPGDGVLTQVLGARGAPGVDTLSIIYGYGLPDEFDSKVLDAARLQADRFDETAIGDRRDLTNDTIITIDPVDARDFDDAISLHLDERGHWFLGVHIADVAFFVPEKSALDEEAYRRGTSVYLPDRVLPMLPEIISNGLASLQQDRVRFTKTVVMEFDTTGVHIHTDVYNSAIKVTQRFAYEQVMPIVQQPERFIHDYSDDVLRLLVRMHQLAMKLRQRRFAHGALELTMPEVKVQIATDGSVAGAVETAHDESHQIIEEFMLAANVAVAEWLARKQLPFLRRVHGDPDEVKLRVFGTFATSLGYPIQKVQSRAELQRLLNAVLDTPHRQAINFALLRSMKQAEYSPEDVGHYALAAEDYCHFTSPIRRYPDLTIHRLVEACLRGGGKPARFPGMSELTAIGQHCSRTERRAEEAERELIKSKLLAYMSKHVGEEFQAVITGVQDFGFFCQLVEIPAEGLVSSMTLDDDYYYMDSDSHTLIARRSGKQYRLGDRVKIVVARVDLDRRQLDLRLVGSRAAAGILPGVPAPAGEYTPSGGRPGQGSGIGPMRAFGGGRKGDGPGRGSGRFGGRPGKGGNAGGRGSSSGGKPGKRGSGKPAGKKGKKKRR